MNNYLALLICVAVIIGLSLLPRLHIWRKCQCGARYCTSCGRKE